MCRRVERWFQDEARVGQKGSLTSIWTECGTRPTAPKHAAYANVHVLTAVCPQSDRAEGLVAPPAHSVINQTLSRVGDRTRGGCT